MAFFRREPSPVARFEGALRDRLAARQKLAGRLRTAEAELGEKRAAAERLAVAGAANARLDRAEASMRAVESHAKTLAAALAECDEQVAAAERALADAIAQRDRNLVADEIEAMAAAIERAAPGFEAGAATLIESVTKRSTTMPEATRFSTTVDAMRREVLSAVELVCWELRSAAVHARAGNANVACDAPSESEQPPLAEIERQLIYTLHPLLWREGGEVTRVPAFALVGLPKALLPTALRHQHVDHLNARRVQTLMHLHGSEGLVGDPQYDELQPVDLDALIAAEKPDAQVDVA
ncbi:hypothetical protein [Bradyrhizobium sp.]|uniref:hypothetical protein n=1 Tax=Bradyrhizobium sp. TaxID=376 RepID=UPI0025C19533|nr:hypothetical protein [Bradyrhizobium sp.]